MPKPKKKWKRPEIKTIHPEVFSEEEMKSKSVEIRENRAGRATVMLAIYSVRHGSIGSDTREQVQSLLVNLFHLSDSAGFNLENLIDQARCEYQGQVKVDEIEEEHLKGAIREDRLLLDRLRASGAEACLSDLDT